MLDGYASADERYNILALTAEGPSIRPGKNEVEGYDLLAPRIEGLHLANASSTDSDYLDVSLPSALTYSPHLSNTTSNSDAPFAYSHLDRGELQTQWGDYVIPMTADSLTYSSYDRLSSPRATVQNVRTIDEVYDEAPV